MTRSTAQGVSFFEKWNVILRGNFGKWEWIVKLVRFFVFWCGLASFFLMPVLAHQTTDSFLALALTNNRIEGKWSISLRDLDHVLSVDENKDGEVSDAELSRGRSKIESYVLTRVFFEIGGKAAKITTTGFEIEEHADAYYIGLSFLLPEGMVGSDVRVRYTLFNDTDPLHRGLFRFDLPKRTETAIFSPSQPSRTFYIEEGRAGERFLNFVREGVWHIWTGFDHILFLIALLLPSVLHREKEGWAPAASARAALLNIVKVVTAFTIAHSFTLTLATLGLVNLPSRIVESVIAASVVVAALNNLKTFFAERTWIIAFSFGLIHGFGFASALTELHLNSGSLAATLVGFNFGVELGQLAIVLVFVPIAFSLRKTNFYQEVALRYCSLLIAVLAGAWFFERALDRRILPF